MKDIIEKTFHTSKNHMVYDIPGSGKSVHTIQVINELELAPNEVIIWCGYSYEDLLEKQKRITKKSQIIFSRHNDKNIQNITSLKKSTEVILMPLQYYRKFSPVKDIQNREKVIRKVVIDELSFIDIIVPSMLSKNYVFGEHPEEGIKKKFSKFDYQASLKKMNEKDDSNTWAHFITNTEVSHLVLSTEKLTSLCLKEIGFTIIQGDLKCKSNCVLNVWCHENITRDFISYCDMSENWDELGYESIFCNASKDDFTTNHTIARGSNKFIGNTCLSIFRRFGNRAEYSIKEILKDMLKEPKDKLLKIYYTDCLNQIVSRTLGWRGEEVVDCLMHPNCEQILDKSSFPYKIRFVKKPFNTSLEKIVYGCNKTNTEFKQDLIFAKEYSMTTVEMKEVAGIPGTKAAKALICEGYDLQIKKRQKDYLIIGCKGVEK